MKNIIVAFGAIFLLFPISPFAQVRNQNDLAPEAEMLRKVRAAEPDKALNISIPLYGGFLKFNLIEDFEPVYQAQNQRQFLKEYVPKGQTVKNWSKMITILALRDAGRTSRTNIELVKLFASTRQCEGFAFSELVNDDQMDNGLSLTTFTSGCGNNTQTAYLDAVAGSGEQNLIFLFRDPAHIQMLQYAVRGSKFTKGGEPLDDKEISGLTTKLGPIQFCVPSDKSDDCQMSRAAEQIRKGQKP